MTITEIMQKCFEDMHIYGTGAFLVSEDGNVYDELSRIYEK